MFRINVSEGYCQTHALKFKETLPRKFFSIEDALTYLKKYIREAKFDESGATLIVNTLETRYEIIECDDDKIQSTLSV